MQPSKMYLTLTHIFTLTCVLNQHLVHSDLWERPPSHETVCRQDLIVKQFLRKLLSTLPDLKYSSENFEEIREKIDYQLNFELSLHEQKILKEFVDSHANFDDVVDIMSHMVKNIDSTGNDLDINFTEYFSDPVHMYFLIALVVIVVATFTLNIFTRQRIWRLAILMFFINVMWNWFYLYEDEKAKTLHAVEGGIPKDCPTEVKPLTSQIIGWFQIETDACKKYIALVTINPFFRVRPYEALSISVVNIIFRPLQNCGEYIGKFIIEICAPLPFYMQGIFIILMMMIMAIITIVTLLILNDCSFSTLLFSIGKSNNNKINDKLLNKLLEKLDTLENRISTQDQLEDVAVLLKKYIKESEDLKPLNHSLIAGGDCSS